MDSGAWRALVLWVAKSQTHLKHTRAHAHMHTCTHAHTHEGLSGTQGWQSECELSHLPGQNVNRKCPKPKKNQCQHV